MKKIDKHTIIVSVFLSITIPIIINNIYNETHKKEKKEMAYILKTNPIKRQMELDKIKKRISILDKKIKAKKISK